MADISTRVSVLPDEVKALIQATFGIGKVGGGDVSASGGVLTIPSGYQISCPARGQGRSDLIELTSAVQLTATNGDRLFLEHRSASFALTAAAPEDVPADALVLGTASGTPVDTFTQDAATGGKSDLVFDSDAIHGNLAAEVSALTQKGTPIGADQLLIEDSENSDAKRRILISDLPGGAAPVKSYALIRMSSSQSTDLLAGNHVQFNAITEQSANADISVSTGAGQANGLITLPAGKIFLVECQVGVIFGSAVSSFRLQIRDNTGAALIGEFTAIEPETLAGDIHTSSVVWAFAPAGALEIEVRIIFVSGTVTQIQQSGIRGTMLRVSEL